MDKKTQPQIIQVQTERRSGLYEWKILGLNVFVYNDVPCSLEERPDVRFLSSFTASSSCSAHVGSLALKDLVNAPTEVFGLPDGATPFTRTRVSYHDGFYDLNEWPCFDACFFPQITSLFWEAMLRENALEQMLRNHGMAFYVGATPAGLVAMQSLLAQPFPGAEAWLAAVTTLYPLVVTVGHDGQFFHAYARNESALCLLEPSLAVAEEAIQTSAWFQAHQDRLVWDDNLNACLMLAQ